MHNPEGMLKPRMHRSWINHFCPCQLTDTPQTLERRLVNQIVLPLIQRNKTVDRVTYFMLRFHILILSTLATHYYIRREKCLVFELITNAAK